MFSPELVKLLNEVRSLRTRLGTCQNCERCPYPILSQENLSSIKKIETLLKTIMRDSMKKELQLQSAIGKPLAEGELHIPTVLG